MSTCVTFQRCLHFDLSTMSTIELVYHVHFHYDYFYMITDYRVQIYNSSTMSTIYNLSTSSTIVAVSTISSCQIYLLCTTGWPGARDTVLSELELDNVAAGKYIPAYHKSTAESIDTKRFGTDKY